MALGTEDKMPRGSVDELGRLHPLPGAAGAAQPATDWSKFVPDQPAAGPWQKFEQQPQTDWSQFVPEQQREMGPISTLAQGFRNTGRAVGATADVALDDRASVVERANAQAAAPKNENLRSFESELESRRAALGTDDPGLLDALGVVGGAVLAQPKGAGYAVLEQAPNAVAALAPAWAGAKLGATAGAAIPLPGAAPTLGVVGGLAGLFLGNTALEVGNKRRWRKRPTVSSPPLSAKPPSRKGARKQPSSPAWMPRRWACRNGSWAPPRAPSNAPPRAH